MRTLLLMRGAPGAGKSTWIKQNNLQNYTLSPDNIRLMCSSIDLHADGTFAISQERDNEAVVWEVLFKILEHRMKRGEFTVIDATCSKTKDMQQYKQLADSYRYRVYCVDFTNVPLETCLEQNKLRPTYKQVPEEAIKNIYARFATQQIPASIKVIKPDEFNNLLELPISLNEYKKLVIVGDIHGCYDTLMQYSDFKDGLKDDTEYIFVGDYIDRGNQNAEVMNYLFSIMDKPNVCFLEGNHERYLYEYGNAITSRSKVFEYKTKPQLIKGGFDAKKARMFYRKLRQFTHFTFCHSEFLVCHGGIPNLNNNLLYLPTSNFIHGVGEYDDYLTIADSWMSQTQSCQYLIHGHRNVNDDETHLADRVFNLEGKVEFGGQLRIVELFEDNDVLRFNCINLDDCQPITEDLETETRAVETVEEAVNYLRNNKYIQEKQLGNNISSFNFTREAFLKANWSRQTILARGLFIDTENNKIVARSYEKFFRINETSQTKLQVLKQKLQFPVKAYVKENGFLAIVSYDVENDDLLVFSKSTNRGDYVEYIEAQLEPYREKIIESYRNGHSQCLTDGIEYIAPSLVFECIDVENDPHIIKYEKSKLVLLDCILNTLEFTTLPYKKLQELAEFYGCPVKELAYDLKDWDEFYQLYLSVQDETYKYKDEYIEGYVFVDASGFMTKCKTEYYNKWKKLRGVADQALKSGYIRSTGSLQTAEENLFYGFCRDCFKNDRNEKTKEYSYKTDIISMRERFQKGLNNVS